MSRRVALIGAAIVLGVTAVFGGIELTMPGPRTEAPHIPSTGDVNSGSGFVVYKPPVIRFTRTSQSRAEAIALSLSPNNVVDEVGLYYVEGNGLHQLCWIVSTRPRGDDSKSAYDVVIIDDATGMLLEDLTA